MKALCHEDVNKCLRARCWKKPNHTVHFTDRCEPCRYANFFKRPLPSQKQNPVLKLAAAARLNLLLRMAIHHHINTVCSLVVVNKKNWLVSHITIRRKKNRNFKGGATHVLRHWLMQTHFSAETFSTLHTYVYILKALCRIKTTNSIIAIRMDLWKSRRPLWHFCLNK